VEIDFKCGVDRLTATYGWGEQAILSPHFHCSHTDNKEQRSGTVCRSRWANRWGKWNARCFGRAMPVSSILRCVGLYKPRRSYRSIKTHLIVCLISAIAQLIEAQSHPNCLDHLCIKRLPQLFVAIWDYFAYIWDYFITRLHLRLRPFVLGLHAIVILDFGIIFRISFHFRYFLSLLNSLQNTKKVANLWTKVLSFRGALPPEHPDQGLRSWIPLGAVPHDSRYRLAFAMPPPALKLVPMSLLDRDWTIYFSALFEFKLPGHFI